MLFIRKISAIIFTITSPCLGYALLGRHTFKLMGAASITCKKEISYLISFLAHQYILGISRFPLWKKVIRQIILNSDQEPNKEEWVYFFSLWTLGPNST